MRVLVVARTGMLQPDRVCVGAIELDTGRSLRLKRMVDGGNALESHPMRPGSIWDLSYQPDQSVTQPHVEDVLVSGGHHVEDVPDMRSAILSVWEPWDCPLDDIFEGTLDVTEAGSAFVPTGTRVPSGSTGFWISRQGATIDSYERYWFEGGQRIQRTRWKGMTAATRTIPRGALIRFSLARWAEFPPGVGELRCYLQLSAWFT